MPSPTDLCNDALAQIGHNFITNIDDDDRPATVCKRFYDTTRDEVLRQHLWNFAITRQILVQDLTPALSEFSFTYNLPADALRALRIGSTDVVPWKLERRKIHTDESVVTLTYIARIEDPVQWDTLFYNAFATRLASKLAVSIAHDIQFGDGLYKQYQQLVLDAAAVDSQEGTPITMRVPDLIDIRNTPS